MVVDSFPFQIRDFGSSARDVLVSVFDVVSASAPDPLLVEALGPEGA